jgi:flagellar hook-length control protein FliK
MQIRLDPPELGALQVTVELRDGAMNATFQTSNDDATRLLSHSLGQLKTALESQGVTVDKIQVQQAPKDHPSGQTAEDSSQQQQQRRDDAEARQEQQRREMLRQMWRRISGDGRDPIDLVA